MQVVDLISSHFGGKNGRDLPPIFMKDNKLELISKIASVSHSTLSLSYFIKKLDEMGSSAILIKYLGLKSISLDEKRKYLYGLCSLIGWVSYTDPRSKRCVWDVKDMRSLDNTENGKSKFWSFSETNDEATYHTDTQYWYHPENFFILYCVNQASCGGGINNIKTVSSILNGVKDKKDGAKAINFLKETKLPFRVPTIFTDDGKSETLQYTYAKILNNLNHLRYRKDTLYKGLHDNPEYYTDECKKAFDLLESVIFDPSNSFEHSLASDELLFVNNYRAVHSRTSFSDPGRLLLRVRIQDEHSYLYDKSNEHPLNLEGSLT